MSHRYEIGVYAASSAITPIPFRASRLREQRQTRTRDCPAFCTTRGGVTLLQQYRKNCLIRIFQEWRGQELMPPLIWRRWMRRELRRHPSAHNEPFELHIPEMKAMANLCAKLESVSYKHAHASAPHYSFHLQFRLHDLSCE